MEVVGTTPSPGSQFKRQAKSGSSGKDLTPEL
jgi:hypothetical protein